MQLLITKLLDHRIFFYSGSSDHTTKFWCRNRPGDTLRDRFNPGMQGLFNPLEANEQHIFLFSSESNH